MNVYERTENQSHHFGDLYEIAKLEAAGYQWPRQAMRNGKLHPDQYKRYQARFNGGVAAQLEVRLQRGDKIYRFAASNTRLEQHIAGRWWFDYDTCVFLWSKSGPGSTDAGFRKAARAAFAVLEEWGDMGQLVTGVLARDFWAIKGNSAPARTPKSGAIHTPFGLSALQLFVPGGFSREHFESIKPAALTRLVY